MDFHSFFFSIIFSLEEAYEALRKSEVLRLEIGSDIRVSTCRTVVDTLLLPTTAPKELFHALKVNGILKCELNEEVFKVCKSSL